MSLVATKRAIRKSLLLKRLALAPDEVGRRSLLAQTLLMGLEAFQSSETLALYSPIRNEVETAKLLETALAEQKRVYLPCIKGSDLIFSPVTSEMDLVVGDFGIREPASRENVICLAEIDLLLLPGVAFDLSGQRLGYGKGFFDRLLRTESFKGLSVGFAYDFQVQERLPVEDHDQAVALMVTERQIYSPLSSD